MGVPKDNGIHGLASELAHQEIKKRTALGRAGKEMAQAAPPFVRRLAVLMAVNHSHTPIAQLHDALFIQVAPHLLAIVLC